MAQTKDTLDNKIAAMISTSVAHRVIARRLFLYDFSQVFFAEQDRGFSILNSICERFNVPFSAVQVVGSAHTGYSYFSQADFKPGESDLDVAIVSSNLFQHYSQEVYWLTRRYSDLSRFSRKGGISVAQDFRNYLSSGYFRPDLMPECPLKADWWGFFNRLSNKHIDLFRNINAGIYLSEAFFEMKNASLLEAYGKACK
jgi:hypothetical protein